MLGTGSKTNIKTRVLPVLLSLRILQEFYKLCARDWGQRPLYIYSLAHRKTEEMAVITQLTLFKSCSTISVAN